MTTAKCPVPTDPQASVPHLRLHGFRLDYNAALAAIARGACAAQIAIAAGSRATSRRNLRRVGLKIVDRLVHSGQIRDTFDQLGYTIEQFCQSVVDAAEATKTIYFSYRGKVTDVREVPDWKTQTKAADLYMRAIGIDRWPVLQEHVAKLVQSRSYDEWLAIASLSPEELGCLIELAIDRVASRRRRQRSQKR